MELETSLKSTWRLPVSVIFCPQGLWRKTHIGCCTSNRAQTEIIPNVNKSADAQLVYRVMTHANESSVDQIMMAETSGKGYVGLAFAVPNMVRANSMPIWAAMA
jgi:uncharacterized protein (DUF736 family)